jgi:ribosomal protein S18 acetylase RimI-like enzyme
VIGRRSGRPAPLLRAAPSDVPALAAVLARAFAADPMVRWPFGPVDDLSDRIEAMFEIVDRAYAAEGWIHAAAGGLGVMSLLPPGSGAREHEIGQAVASAIGALMADDGARYERLWAWVDATLPPDPRWLLDQLAVDPTAQRQGIGGAMLRHAIGLAEADGLALVLETAAPKNVRWYERFGFRVTVAADAPGGGPHIWYMARDPWGPAGPAPDPS